MANQNKMDSEILTKILTQYLNFYMGMESTLERDLSREETQRTAVCIQLMQAAVLSVIMMSGFIQGCQSVLQYISVSERYHHRSDSRLHCSLHCAFPAPSRRLLHLLQQILRAELRH